MEQTKDRLIEIKAEIMKALSSVKVTLKTNFLKLGELFNEAEDICLNAKVSFKKWVNSQTDISYVHVKRLISIYKYGLVHSEIKQLNYKKAWNIITVKKEQVVTLGYHAITQQGLKQEEKLKEIKVDKNKELIIELKEKIKVKDIEIEELKNDVSVLKKDNERLDDFKESLAPDLDLRHYKQFCEQLEQELDRSKKCPTCISIHHKLKQLLG